MPPVVSSEKPASVRPTSVEPIKVSLEAVMPSSPIDAPTSATPSIPTLALKRPSSKSMLTAPSVM